jgi:hypothetical protein
MNFVDICERTVSVGQLHDPADRRDVTIHRVEALEDDQLGAIGTRLG